MTINRFYKCFEQRPASVLLYSMTRIFQLMIWMIVLHSSAYAQSDAANPLLKDLWKSRPLIVIVPDAKHPMLLHIKQALSQKSIQIEFQDRHMVLYVLINETASRGDEALNHAERKAMLDALGPIDPFKPSAILIGLDGGIKFIADEKIELQTLFTLIDGMPMRQKQPN
jgi:hypothetical protein